MTITFQREKLATLWDEIQPLWRLHWEEFAIDRDKIPLGPDKEKYLRLDAGKTFYLITIRDGDELVGYWMGFVDTGLHYETIVQGHTDIFFAHPRYAGRPFMILRLLEEKEKLERDLGAKRVYVCEKIDHPLDAIMERLGYRLTERIYSKLLE